MPAPPASAAAPAAARVTPCTVSCARVQTNHSLMAETALKMHLNQYPEVLTPPAELGLPAALLEMLDLIRG